MTAERLAQQRIGAAVRAARGTRTQKAVEKTSGIDQSVLSKIETGDYRALTPGLILRLCLALEVKPSQLVDLDDVYTIARYEAQTAGSAA